MTAAVRAGGPGPAPVRAATLVTEPAWFAARGIRALLRQPWYVAFTLLQPIVWLLLFGTLFERVVPAPTGDYLAFLTPGIVVMTALFSQGWAGTGFLTDAERGVMDRLLVSPARRGSMIAGSLVHQQVITVVQTAIILGLGYATGARFPGGPAVTLAFVGCTVLLGAAFASYSNALALLLRAQEALIGAVNFVVLPLSFLSAMLVPAELLPGWIADVARWNPVNWAVEVGRQLLAEDVDWGIVGTRAAALGALAAVAAWGSTRAFAAYQRSV